MIDKLTHGTQEAGDVCGSVVICSSFFGWLPNITALFALIWFILRVWESETIREWTNRVKE